MALAYNTSGAMDTSNDATLDQLNGHHNVADHLGNQPHQLFALSPPTQYLNHQQGTEIPLHVRADVGNEVSTSVAANGENPAEPSNLLSRDSCQTHINSSGKRRHNESSSLDPSSKKSTNNSGFKYSVSVNNRYAPLENLTDLEENRFKYINDTTDEESESTRIPPIIINNITNMSEFNNQIKNNITNQFTTKVINNNLKLMFSTISNFRKAVKFLITSKIQFHTYKDPANKKFSVVFKNIHPSISQEEIYQDLKEQCSSLISVTRLHKDNIPIPVVAAEFDGQQSIETVLQIKYICNTTVKPEKRRKFKGPVQCLRCLDFGHTKNNCNRNIACVFCAKDHYSVNCPQKNLPPLCKNCKGNHRGDLRSVECPYYKKQVELPPRNFQATKTNAKPNNDIPSSLTSHNFPNLPPTNNIPNFNFVPSTNLNSNPSQLNQNHPALNNTNSNNNNNSFMQSLINSITTHIINIINSIIPTIISSIQSSLASYVSSNHGISTP